EHLAGRVADSLHVHHPASLDDDVACGNAARTAGCEPGGDGARVRARVRFCREASVVERAWALHEREFLNLRRRVLRLACDDALQLAHALTDERSLQLGQPLDVDGALEVI